MASPSPVRVETPTAPTPGPQSEAPAAASDAPGVSSSDELAADAAAADNPADGADGEPIDDWRAFVPTDTADHLATMDRAARDSGCGVPWHLLAAIARVESDFGRNMATSSAGAVGYGQFLPSSWRAFGNEGNVYDYRDALPAIATYLCESGLARDPRSALFAYNHAEWYVDLVLQLAVRYDRMAPGAPTPDVLDVGPAAEAGLPLRYAPGRDVKLQARARSIDAQAAWLGVPWRGRGAGTLISRSALESTTLAMLLAAYGLSGDLPKPTTIDGDGLGDLADRAWAGGLLPLRRSPQAFTEPGREAWSLAEVRSSVQRGWPVVALVAARLLPGHPPTEGGGDQPLVITGVTPDGLIYNDPTFSSNLGYGLELKDEAFLNAWQAAATPRQALAFTTRPKPPSREAHLREAAPPPFGARILATPVPPTAVPTPAPASASAEAVGPGVQSATALAQESATDLPQSDAAALTSPADAPATAAPLMANGATVAGEPWPYAAWAIVPLGAGIAAAGLWLRRRRARPRPGPLQARQNMQDCT